MARIEIRDGYLVMTPTGLHKALTLTRKIEIPLANVARVIAEPDIAHAPVGARVLGTSVPGVVTAGAVSNGGVQEFWDVRTPAKAIVVELARERFARLVVEVDDPQRVARSIERALRDGTHDESENR
jgi:hypothetical protein